MTNPPEFQVTSGGAIALQQPVSVSRKSPSRLFWERLRQDKAALAGGAVIVLLVLIAADAREHNRGRPGGKRADPRQRRTAHVELA